jgi:hypothetical protein
MHRLYGRPMPQSPSLARGLRNAKTHTLAVNAIDCTRIRFKREV